MKKEKILSVSSNPLLSGTCIFRSASVSVSYLIIGKPKLPFFSDESFGEFENVLKLLLFIVLATTKLQDNLG